MGQSCNVQTFEGAVYSVTTSVCIIVDANTTGKTVAVIPVEPSLGYKTKEKLVKKGLLTVQVKFIIRLVAVN